MATALYDERLEFGGVPLDTPAWEVTNNYGWLYSAAEELTADFQPGGYPGLVTAPVLRGAKRGPLVIAINGTVDSDGAAHPDQQTGLRTNFDELLGALATPPNLIHAARDLAHVHPSVATRSGPGRISVVDVQWLAGTVAEVTADCIIPRGVLASVDVDTSTSGSIGSTSTFTVTNPGTSFQEWSTITLSGGASTVLLENLSWDPDGAAALTVDVALGAGDVVIDTRDRTAVQGGSDVHGGVAPDLHVLRTWLPLVQGDNTWRVTPTGGSVTVTVEHRPAFR